MDNIRTTVSIEKEIYKKVQNKIKRESYKNLNEYLNFLIRRDITRKKVGGKLPKLKTARLFTMKKVLAVDGKPFKI